MCFPFSSLRAGGHRPPTQPPPVACVPACEHPSLLRTGGGSSQTQANALGGMFPLKINQGKYIIEGRKIRKTGNLKQEECRVFGCVSPKHGGGGREDEHGAKESERDSEASGKGIALRVNLTGHPRCSRPLTPRPRRHSVGCKDCNEG